VLRQGHRGISRVRPAASMSGSDISGYASGACPTSRSVCVNTTSPKRRSTCSRVREKDFGTRPGLMSGSWPGRSEKSRTVLDAKHGAGLDGPKIACSNSLSGVRVSHAWRKKDTPYEGSEWPKPAKHGNIIGIMTATDEPLSGPAAAGRAVGLRGSGRGAWSEIGRFRQLATALRRYEAGGLVRPHRSQLPRSKAPFARTRKSEREVMRAESPAS